MILKVQTIRVVTYLQNPIDKIQFLETKVLSSAVGNSQMAWEEWKSEENKIKFQINISNF